VLWDEACRGFETPWFGWNCPPAIVV